MKQVHIKIKRVDLIERFGNEDVSVLLIDANNPENSIDICTDKDSLHVLKAFLDIVKTSTYA